jgi:hypothetical protein
MRQAHREQALVNRPDCAVLRRSGLKPRFTPLLRTLMAVVILALPGSPIAPFTQDALTLAPDRESDAITGTTVDSIAAPAALPDLVVESITLVPSNPQPGEYFDLEMLVRNRGPVSVDPLFGHRGYVDPADRPPTPSTFPDSDIGWGLGLLPGESHPFVIAAVMFETSGCGHVAYAWVDWQNDVVEIDETNNLKSKAFCVGAQEDLPDAYEPADNLCSGATNVVVNAPPPTHTLAPGGDVDWYVITATAGVEYRFRAVGTGLGGRPSLTLKRECPVLGTFGGGSETTYTPPVDGPVRVRVSNILTNTSDTGYTLQVTSQRDCAGFYEPNDTRSSANSLASNGLAQRHTFCAVDDEDWLKLEVDGGNAYVLRAASAGARAAPQLSVEQGAGDHGYEGNPITLTASADAVRYLRVTNGNGAVGPATAYSISLTLLPMCAPDAFEDDDLRQLATVVIPNGLPQTRTICPKGDHDWTKFSASQGITYTVEALWQGSDAETVLCITDGGGTNLACDEGSPILRVARITWVAPASDVYFVRARHADPFAAGPNTEYRFSISSGACQADFYEPDGTPASAPILPADGTLQPHNFCPRDDVDNVRLAVPQAGAYSIQTSNLSPGSDTRLELRDIDGVGLLGRNDDYGPGLASRIIYTFSVPGTYYLSVRSFNAARIGLGTGYWLSAFPLTILPNPTSTPTATPTPAPTPTVVPTPTPQMSSVKTLIVTNRSRLEAIYGAGRVAPLLTSLVTLANHPAVAGSIIYLDDNPLVAQAYADWGADPTSAVKANEVTAQVRNLVLGHANRYPSIEYLVIAGDDRIVPSRRIADRTVYSETKYVAAVGLQTNTTVGAALLNNYFLTDDYLSDREPRQLSGRELYAPDLATGRLIETPEQIGALIGGFIASPVMARSKSLVAAYTNTLDLGTSLCALLTQDAQNADAPDCALVGGLWNKTALVDRQFAQPPSFRTQYLGVFGTHSAYSAANNESVTSAYVSSTAPNLSGTLMVFVGSHTGLNVPETSNLSLDLAEVFSARRALVVGQTGYAWWNDAAILMTERVMKLFAEELRFGTHATVGSALARAKANYLRTSLQLDAIDEKVVQQAVLYGLPMYEVLTEATFDVPFPGVAMSLTLGEGGAAARGQPGLPSADLVTGKGALSLRIDGGQNLRAPGNPVGAYTAMTTSRGTYYALDGQASNAGLGPIQPVFFATISPPPGQRLKGIALTGASFLTVTADPVFAVPSVDETEFGGEPADWSGAYPPIGFSLDGGGSLTLVSPTLMVALGKSDPASQVQWLYTDVGYDVYYSNSADDIGPVASSVDGYYDLQNGFARMKVEAADESGIARVVVAYTLGTGTWKSQNLQFRADTGKWSGIIPFIRGASYFVQIVDGAGNVAKVAPRQGFFDLPLVADGGYSEGVAFLPLTLR